MNIKTNTAPARCCANWSGQATWGEKQDGFSIIIPNPLYFVMNCIMAQLTNNIQTGLLEVRYL